MSDNYNNEFDRALRDKLGDYRAPYNPDDWARMQEQLDGKPGKKRGGYLLPALLLLLLGAGVVGWSFWNPGGEGRNMVAAGQEQESQQQSEETSEENRESDSELDAEQGSLAASTAEQQNTSSPISSELDREHRMSDFAPELQSAASTTASRENETTRQPNAIADQSSASGLSTATPQGESALEDAAGNTAPSFEDFAMGTVAGRVKRDAGSEEEGDAEVEEDEPLFSSSMYDPEFRARLVDKLDEKFAPQIAVSTIAASSDDPVIQLTEEDRTELARKGKLRLVLSPSVGLNSTHTEVLGGFSPSWDAGFSLEMQFRERVSLTTGIRYGQYAFAQTKVGCGDPASVGVPYTVNCPASLDGEIGTFEIPIRIDWLIPLKKTPGNFRLFGGLSGQYRNSQHYEVRFEDFQAGDVLYFPPIIVEVANNVGVATYTLNIDEEADLAFAVPPVGSAESTYVSKRFTVAGELGFGYEQFLSKQTSLAIEPRLTVPFSRLEINDRRNATMGVNARLRFYIGGR